MKEVVMQIITNQTPHTSMVALQVTAADGGVCGAGLQQFTYVAT